MSGFVGNTMFSYRSLNGLGLLTSAGAIAFTTTYLQQQLALEPCLLCILTRLLILAIAVIFFLAFVHNPGKSGQQFYSFLTFVLTLGGIGITVKHIWIQSQSLNVATECDTNFDPLFATMPSIDVLIQIFKGASECAVSQWTMMGLTIPEQALILFTALLIITWKVLSKKQTSRGLFR